MNENAQGRTYLDTSDGLSEYAKRHGARYDQERCSWYVVGEVPGDLLNLIPKASRAKEAPVVPPGCPVCGFHTKLIEGKHGPFFGCSQHSVSGCKGSVGYDEYLERIGRQPLKTVDGILRQGRVEKRASGPEKTTVVSLEANLKAALQEIGQLCITDFQSTAEFERWLSTPKLALDGKKPLECLKTIDGCNRVKALIATRYD